MTHGELEARILDGDRALASAPPDVSRELRLTARAEADAWQQAADAEIKHDPAASAGTTALARHMATRREQLEAANARYEKWATDTSGKRDAAGKARAELERRGLAPQAAERRQPEAEGGPKTVVEWWRQLEADLAAVDRALDALALPTGRVLFVARSPYDIPGAGRLGRDAWWHNRIGMPGRPVLVAEHRSLDPLRPLPAGAGGHRHR